MHARLCLYHDFSHAKASTVLDVTLVYYQRETVDSPEIRVI